MKKLILTAVTLASATTVFAQGTVTFSTRDANGSSHIWIGGPTQIIGRGITDNPTGAMDYAALGAHLIGTVSAGGGGLFEAQHWFSQLLGAPGAGQPESGLIPSSSPPTTFRTGSASGQVALTTATFNNIQPDAPNGTFQMVVWDNSSGLYPTWGSASTAWQAGLIFAGRGNVFSLTSIGGNLTVPPSIEPFAMSFNIVVPEPSTVALLGLGAAGILIFRRK
jgi:hypothetical protein